MDSDSHGLLDGHAKGMQLQFNEVIGMINAELGTNIKQKYVENPLKNYVRDTLADTRKCRETLGFQARISLEERIRRLVAKS